MRRSHLSTKKNTMVHRVDRREPKVGGKRLSENGKSPGFVPGMKLKSNGYGPWAELEAKLYPKPRPGSTTADMKPENSPSVTDVSGPSNGGSQQPAGCAAGSITHSFQIELTRKQAKALKAIWTEHGKMNGAIIMQPALNWGVCDLKNCYLRGAVLDEEATEKISDKLGSFQRHNAGDERRPEQP